MAQSQRSTIQSNTKLPSKMQKLPTFQRDYNLKGKSKVGFELNLRNEKRSGLV